MKECAYCGGKNDDEAVHCSSCGTEEFKTDAPAEKAKLDEWDELVTVCSCQTLPDADLLVGRLEAAGIETFVPDEFLMQTIAFNLNTYGYVRVQVRRKDYENARELCAATVGKGNLPPEGKPAVTNSSAGKATEDAPDCIQCVACDARIPKAARLCPKCGWTQHGG